MRGVYRSGRSATCACFGSSPLARGLRETPVVGAPVGWIFPACAGFTRTPGSSTPHGPDHPRLRGVYLKTVDALVQTVGSSPLARGLPARSGRLLTPAGIIPARAGFTEGHPRRGPTGSDHPRSRGVYGQEVATTDTPTGSSPLARGLPSATGIAPMTSWIIPARAGFTVPLRDQVRPPQDHPRSRGVYLEPEVLDDGPAGSSPLARGLPAGGLGDEAAPGIIPARAGFTPTATRAPPCTADHPRSRGVYTEAT